MLGYTLLEKLKIDAYTGPEIGPDSLWLINKDFIHMPDSSRARILDIFIGDFLRIDSPLELSVRTLAEQLYDRLTSPIIQPKDFWFQLNSSLTEDPISYQKEKRLVRIESLNHCDENFQISELSSLLYFIMSLINSMNTPEPELRNPLVVKVWHSMIMIKSGEVCNSPEV